MQKMLQKMMYFVLIIAHFYDLFFLYMCMWKTVTLLIFSEPVYSLLLFNKFVKYDLFFFTDLEKETII